MPKKNSVSAFDELLDGIATPEDREALNAIAERNRILKDSVLMQSDYSRNMNALSEREQKLAEQAGYVSEWEQWKNEHWDQEHGMTRAQFQSQVEADRLKTEKDELERKILLGSQENDVDAAALAALEQKLTDKISGQFQATLAAKEEELKTFVRTNNGVTAKMMTDASRIMFEHAKEFDGEILNPDDLLKAAIEKQRYDLPDFYQKEYIADKRTQRTQSQYEAREAKMKAEYDTKMAAQQKDFEERAEKLKGMGSGGQNLSDSGPAEMGAFQRSYLGLNKSTDGISSNGVPDKAALGEGTIAAIAARNDFDKAAGRL